MSTLITTGDSSPVDQVLRWKNDRLKVGGQKKVTFKELYEDYEIWVTKCTGQCVLKKTSFSYYFYIVFKGEIDNFQIYKTKRHPVSFLNSEIVD